MSNNHTPWETVERGIRRYFHTTRKHGKKFDTYYALRFKIEGKSYEEGLGWASEGWTLEKVRTTLAELRTAQRTGQGAVSLQEKREQASATRKADAEKPTIARLWEYYLESKGGYTNRATDLSSFKHFAHLHNRLPETLKTPEVDALRRKLEEQGKKPQTIRNILELLRRLVNFGAKHELSPRPSSLIFNMPKIDNQKTECLTEEQAKQLFIVLAEQHDQIAANIVRMALATGMRRGALLALEWRDIDFTRGFITLRGENAKKGKTEIIPLNESARTILESTPRYADSPIVFHNGEGKKRVDVNRFLRNVRNQAGLPADFRMLHGLRHTFASWLASSGAVDMFTLQKLMTHDTPLMTQRYSHLTDEAMHRAAAVADACLFSALQPDAKANTATNSENARLDKVPPSDNSKS